MKSKDDLKKYVTYWFEKSLEDEIDLKNMLKRYKREIRQQTAQEIFKDLENLHIGRRLDLNYLDMYNSIKQKYLGDEE